MTDLSPARRAGIAPIFGFVLLVLPAVLAPGSPASGGVPAFKKIELLKVGGKVLGDNDKIMFGSPEFADWDGDGKTDLILGYWAMWSTGPRRAAGDGGKVRFYKNISKTPVPEFEDMGDLECHGGLVRLAEA